MTNGPCLVCGYYHRYATTDPEHGHSYTACINTLRGKLEDAEANYEQVGVLIDGDEFIPMDIVRAHLPFAVPPGTECVGVYKQTDRADMEF